LTRVYVDTALTPGSLVELPPETASHLAKVLRARNGDELILFNGDGREFTGAIEAVRGSRLRWSSACRAATAWISSCKRRRNSASRGSCRY
jgi:16S rRNA U1498 N3-methylase RsmE